MTVIIARKWYIKSCYKMYRHNIEKLREKTVYNKIIIIRESHICLFTWLLFDWQSIIAICVYPNLLNKEKKNAKDQREENGVFFHIKWMNER